MQGRCRAGTGGLLEGSWCVEPGEVGSCPPWGPLCGFWPHPAWLPAGPPGGWALPAGQGQSSAPPPVGAWMGRRLQVGQSSARCPVCHSCAHVWHGDIRGGLPHSLSPAPHHNCRFGYTQGSPNVPPAVVCQGHSQTARRAGAGPRRHGVCPEALPPPGFTAGKYLWSCSWPGVHGAASGEGPAHRGAVPPPVERGLL